MQVVKVTVNNSPDEIIGGNTKLLGGYVELFWTMPNTKL